MGKGGLPTTVDLGVHHLSVTVAGRPSLDGITMAPSGCSGHETEHLVVLQSEYFIAAHLVVVQLHYFAVVA